MLASLPYYSVFLLLKPPSPCVPLSPHTLRDAEAGGRPTAEPGSGVPSAAPLPQRHELPAYKNNELSLVAIKINFP